MPEVIKNNSDILFVNHEMIEEIKYEALQSSRHMARLLMHLSHEDTVQEMLIAMGRDCLVTPNRAIGKSESLQIVEGRLLLIIFDIDGNVVRGEEMAPQGDSCSSIYRLNSTPWHTMIPLTEMVVVHETLQGPFESSSEPIPSWIPSDSASMKKFIQEIIVNSGLV
mgnify:CR=1 FL=1